MRAGSRKFFTLLSKHLYTQKTFSKRVKSEMRSRSFILSGLDLDFLIEL